MNASDILKYGHFHLLGTLDGLPEAVTGSAGVCGVWSVKAIVAHLASYENMLTDVLNTVHDPQQPIPHLKRMGEMSPDNFNDAEVADRQGLSWDEVLAEYHAGYERNQQLVAQMTPEVLRQVGTLPWYGAEYALDDFIVYSFYGHKREHGAQIMVYRDTLK